MCLLQSDPFEKIMKIVYFVTNVERCILTQEWVAQLNTFRTRNERYFLSPLHRKLASSVLFYAWKVDFSELVR